ncbi:MAG: xylulokinase [Planctomycetota bacterium]|jgi:D-xylulose kinase
MPLYLGIDLGTQGLKLLVLDPDSGVLCSASRELDLLPARGPGHSEQDPAGWLAALHGAWSDLLSDDSFTPRELAAIGVSGQQHGLVALDAKGDVIRPAKLWNDVSSAPQCEEIISALGGRARLAELTGNHLPAGFTAGKIRWLMQNEPENFQALHQVLLPHDYLNFYLTGRMASEAGDASGTGYFDVRQRCYSDEVLEAIAPNLRPCLPELIDAGEELGTIRSQLAQDLGLDGKVLVSAGGGDNMMAAIGAGATEAGCLVISLGTSGTVFAHADQPVCDPEGEIAAFCDSTGGWLPLGCTMNATVSTELTRQALDLDLQQLEAQASAAPAGCDGLLCLPFFTGERSPDLPRGSGSFLGLRPDNFSPANLLRAAIEGASFSLARLLDRLSSLGIQAERIRLIGGGSRSELWPEIIAAACGRPVELGAHPDSAALGAAIHACWTHRRRERPEYSAAECRQDLRLDGDLRTVSVRSEWKEVYADRRRVFESSIAALREQYPRINP